MELNELISFALYKLTMCNYDVNNSDYKEYESQIKSIIIKHNPTLLLKYINDYSSRIVRIKKDKKL